MLARLLALRAAKRGTRMGGGARRTMRQWLSSAEKQRQRRGPPSGPSQSGHNSRRRSRTRWKPSCAGSAKAEGCGWHALGVGRGRTHLRRGVEPWSESREKRGEEERCRAAKPSEACGLEARVQRLLVRASASWAGGQRLNALCCRRLGWRWIGRSARCLWDVKSDDGGVPGRCSVEDLQPGLAGARVLGGLY